MWNSRAADLEKTQAAPPVDVFEKERIAGRLRRENEPGDMSSGMIGAAVDPLTELFRYHPPQSEDLAKYAAINQAAKNFAEVCRQNCPQGSDLCDAIRSIRMARMTANAAVALRGLNFY